MSVDAVANFAKAQVSTGYLAGDTTIVLSPGGGARFPATPFNATWWNWSTYPDPADDPLREIVRVTNIVTDTLTIVRGQEGTTPSTKSNVGQTYKLMAGMTAKTIADLQSSGGGDTFIKAYKAADGTPINNSTTLVADPDLKFAIGANEIWQWEVGLFWSSATVNLKFAFTGPNAPSIVKIGSDANTQPNEDTTCTAFSTAMSRTNIGNSNHITLTKMDGFCKNGANAGTIQLQMAQDSAVVENTTALAGSYLIAHKIG